MAIDMSRPEAAVTREDLFPEGWEEKLKAQPEAAEEPEPEEGTEELAEAQDEETQAEDQPEAAEAAEGRMSAKEFAKAAGWSLEELYRDVYVERNGEEVSLSQAWDDYDNLRSANEALQEERRELQAKVDRAGTAPTVSPVSPEAQQLMSQAQLYENALQQTDWSQVDKADAANQRLELMTMRDRLAQEARKKQGEWEEKRREEYQKIRAEAEKQTRKLIPEWNSAAVRDKEMGHIKDMAGAYGFQPNEVDAADPRMRKLLRDAWQAMSKVKAVSERAKEVRKVKRRPTLGAGSRAGTGDNKPKLEDVSQRIKDAKTRGEKQNLRLTMPLP